MRPTFTYNAGCPERKQKQIPGRKGVATQPNSIQTKRAFLSLPLKERAFRPPSKSGIKRARGVYKSITALGSDRSKTSCHQIRTRTKRNQRGGLGVLGRRQGGLNPSVRYIIIIPSQKRPLVKEGERKEVPSPPPRTPSVDANGPVKRRSTEQTVLSKNRRFCQREIMDR